MATSLPCIFGWYRFLGRHWPRGACLFPDDNLIPRLGLDLLMPRQLFPSLMMMLAFSSARLVAGGADQDDCRFYTGWIMWWDVARHLVINGGASIAIYLFVLPELMAVSVLQWADQGFCRTARARRRRDSADVLQHHAQIHC